MTSLAVALVSTLLERLELISARSGGQRELCRRAGLAESFIGSTISKLKAKPSAGLSATTASALAKAAGVSLDWLIDGTGPPPDRYPNRVIALDLMRGRVSSDAASFVASIQMHADSDLTVGQWVDELRREDTRQRRGAPLGKPLPPEDDTPPRGKRKR
jgi:transcriptional regulator with XRE-family HTH domain